MREKWKEELIDKDGPEGKRVCDAIVPVMDEWLDRRGRGLTYHMTQMITGHGCFQKYLKRIGKETDSTCIYCQCREDSAQHTLEECTEWTREREELKKELGTADLNLEKVIAETLREPNKWDAFKTFCEDIMRKKEKDERTRRGEEEEEDDSEDMVNGKNNDGKGRKHTGGERNELEKLRYRLRKMKKRKKRRWKVLAHLRK